MWFAPRKPETKNVKVQDDQRTKMLLQRVSCPLSYTHQKRDWRAIDMTKNYFHLCDVSLHYQNIVNVYCHYYTLY